MKTRRRERVKAFGTVAMMFAAALALHAEVLMDFSRVGREVRVGEGPAAYRKDVSQSQLVATEQGLEVRTSAKYETGPSKWMVLKLPDSICADVTGKELLLILAGIPQGRFSNDVSIHLFDRDGETFELRHTAESYGASGEYRLHFDVRDLERNRKRGWGSKLSNGIAEPPLRICAIALHYRADAAEFGIESGEMTLLRVEDFCRGERRAGKTERKVVTRELISTDTTYPGAVPFPGADRLSFKINPSVQGPVTLTLSHGSKGTADQGVLTRHQSVSSNGVARFTLNLPYETQYQFVSLVHSSSADNLREPVGIEMAAGEFTQTAAEAMRLRVETGNPLHLVREERGERPCLVISNPAPRDITWNAHIVLADYFGKEVALHFAQSVRSGDETIVEIPWPLPGRGIWRVHADVRGDDGSVAVKEDRFAWIDLHEVSPIIGKPKFRMGIHYHGTRYLPNMVDITISALVAAGAKFVRCDYDHTWCDIERQPGVYSWNTSDMMIGKLRAAGLSLDVIFAGTPKWAFEPGAEEQANQMKTKGYRVKNCNYLPRAGLFKAFCEQYAKRYGTQIDYYECGNEWDLTGMGTTPFEEFLRVQREAYEGLHAGCPDVCVMPNGWTRPVSYTAGDPKVWQNGLVEYFADHPETYDAWALHCHGAPEAYFVNLSKRFLPMREARPLKSRSWLLNETACSCVNGMEDEVASAVWQKIVYGWAAGASDYIWYNLRATGWFEGSEPGYGLITADYRPRAGYAAFSALSALLQGMDFDATLFSKGLRHLFRFGGSSKMVANGRVLVGWDTLHPGAVCHVDTDARRAMVVDLMGNRTPVEIVNGQATFIFGRRPQALVLEGATRAAVSDQSELDREEVMALVVRGTESRPNVVLDSAANVRDLYEANPAMVHRLWKGRADHSACIWFVPVSGGFVLRASVQDDVKAKGDSMDLIVSEKGRAPRTFHLLPKLRKGMVDSYEQFVDTSSREIGVEMTVHDDDGEGEDSSLFLTREGAGPLFLRLE